MKKYFLLVFTLIFCISLPCSKENKNEIKTGTSPEDIKKGLQKTNNLECVTYKMSIDSNGNINKSGVILKIVSNGDKYITKYKTTINP